MIDVVELRQYTLHPGQRDVLIELFDREFVESQEALGIRVFGQFRDAADSDRFVWVRGFRDMDARRHALGAFYGGPVWAAHRDAANATMIDSDNVLLLRPKGGDFVVPAASERPPSGAAAPTSVIVALLVRPGEHVVAPDEIRGEWLGTYESEHAENTFPALPVRLGEQLEITFSRFDDAAAAAELTAALGRIEHLVLLPTGRSQLR